MQFNQLLFVFLAVCLVFVADAKKSKGEKKYKLSGKRIVAGKYEKRCGKDDLYTFELNDDNVKIAAEYMIKNGVVSAWIGGISDMKVDGEILLNVQAKKRGKYEMHYFSIIPKDLVELYSGAHYALCSRSNEDEE